MYRSTPASLQRSSASVPSFDVVTVAAVDCGATSVRVCRVDLDAIPMTPEVVHRVAHAPVRDGAGHLRWDWQRITEAVTTGLELALAHGPVACIGIDTWAVDYGLLDEHGQLLSDPYSYRDHRTDDYRQLVDEFGAEAMFSTNGLQLQPFNTVFQLARHDRDELRRASRLLWLPELLVHHLTGVPTAERTSAGSSGLLDVHAGTWSASMLDLAGVDADLLGEPSTAGRIVGEWHGVPVALVGGHDTASAVAGMGRASPHGSVFVSSGTWMLAGVERSTPDTSEWARSRNYSNEAGALGGFRFLRNVTGFWLLEQCRHKWGDPEIGALVDAAAQVTGEVPVVDVDDEALRSPDDMLSAYTQLARMARESDPAAVTRSIIESVASRSAEVISELGEHNRADDVVLFGGAARISLLSERIAGITGREVRTGSTEATALGNAIVQGMAIGEIASLDDGRKRVAR